MRHGRKDGCDCCGSNVGGGRMCVWENANHPESQATPPNIPVILPYQSQQSQRLTSDAVQPLHSHMLTLGSVQLNSSHSIASKNNGPHQVTNSQSNYGNNPINKNNHQQQAAQSAATHKPTGGFRIRLYWQRGYKWQGSRSEKFYCLECRGSCRSGSSVQIDKCDSSIRQKFMAVGRTIRPASNPALCLTVTGYSGKRAPVKLRHCNNGGSNQNFRELNSKDKFELQPENNSDRCLSQHHHPKRHEAVYPE
eukprot:CAMPEP_0181086876 /NCGR_PEP_ID=MMETSP1071-20121207/5981_1 /TAXON_ID=35127 /ORGANISM="Thalassiosira sp., Strain NH16" /LENGTH=250 /DNA_ID=CAMNT_0023168743 /DNA_START=37 /DNA_END=786 /DNA_ORIENTATION=-